MAKFGDLLSELRRDKKLTQDELAHILFVTSGTISNYENNVHYPDVVKLIQLANYFEVTTDYLLGNSDIPSLPTSAHNNQSILLLSYFEQLSPEVQNIVLKEVKALTKP